MPRDNDDWGSEWVEEPTQIRALRFVGADRVLVADVDPHTRAWLREILAGHFGVEEVEGGRSALERLASEPPRVFVVGNQLADVTGSVLLTHAARHGLLDAHNGGPAVFTVADRAGRSPDVDESEVPIFFRITHALQPDRVRELIAQGAARLPQKAAKPPSEADAMLTRQVIEHAKRLGMQPDLKTSARTAIAAVMDLTRADRARCMFYDDESGSLWSEGGEDDVESPGSVGICGFAVRAKVGVVLPRAADDPAYRAQVDDPQGDGSERIAVQPVADRDGRIHGVLIAVRMKDRPNFSEQDIRKLEQLAEAWAPFIHQLAQQQEVESVLEAQRDDGARNEVFRQEAIDHLVKRGQRGDVVRVHPGWVHAAYWLVVLFVAGVGAYAALAKISQYAEGPAVIVATDRTPVKSLEPGTVTLEVSPNEEVKKGDIVANLNNLSESRHLDMLEDQFETKLVAYVQSPNDAGIKSELTRLVGDLDTARTNVDARAIRAPIDGVVAEITIADGTRVEPGKLIMTIAKKGAPVARRVLAFLPGQERPRLHTGQRMRFTPTGYRNAHLDIEIDAISAEASNGKTAAEKYLGESYTVPVRPELTYVVVEGPLVATSFEDDDETRPLSTNMLGDAQIELSEKSILETVIPGLY